MEFTDPGLGVAFVVRLCEQSEIVISQDGDGRGDLRGAERWIVVGVGLLDAALPLDSDLQGDAVARRRRDVGR